MQPCGKQISRVYDVVFGRHVYKPRLFIESPYRASPLGHPIKISSAHFRSHDAVCCSLKKSDFSQYHVGISLSSQFGFAARPLYLPFCCSIQGASWLMVAAIVGMKIVSLAEKQDGGGGYKMSVNHHWHQHHRQKALCCRTWCKWVRPTPKLSKLVGEGRKCIREGSHALQCLE